MRVSIMAFKQGQLRVLSHAWDRIPGGRDSGQRAVRVLCQRVPGKAQAGRLLTSEAMPMQVSIMAFKKGQLRVLSHAWDRNLGGRDLDNVLFEYFANEFQEKYKLDVRTNLRGSFRLRMACEKVRRRSDCMIGLATEQFASGST